MAQREAGKSKWNAFERSLHGRAMTLREVLAAQASLITCTLDEADAFLASETRFDPAFVGFVRACRKRSVPLTILSSGIAPLIERALSRNGISGLPVQANGIDARAQGWVMLFRDGSDNGGDKAGAIAQAQARGSTAAFIGDGFSDYDAALQADLRFAKAGRALVDYLCARTLPFAEFTSFDQVTRELFGAIGA
ncbi:MAG: hypothetical protein NVS9B12_10900 [Vulcanimicrobiaceae bacterium]